MPLVANEMRTAAQEFAIRYTDGESWKVPHSGAARIGSTLTDIINS